MKSRNFYSTTSFPCTVTCLILRFLCFLPEWAESLVDEGRSREVVGTSEVDLPVAVQNVVVGGVSDIRDVLNDSNFIAYVLK